MNYELRITNYELRITNYELRKFTLKYFFTHTYCPFSILKSTKMLVFRKFKINALGKEKDDFRERKKMTLVMISRFKKFKK